MSDSPNEAVCEVTIHNESGFHLRPVMQFVDLASRFAATVSVSNVTSQSGPVNGKSALDMPEVMGLKGTVLRIEAKGNDAAEAVAALAALIDGGFPDIVPKTHDDQPADRPG